MDGKKKWKDMRRGACEDNGLKSNVLKEEGWRQEGKGCFACTSGAMSIDNGLHLMSPERRDSRERVEG